MKNKLKRIIFTITIITMLLNIVLIPQKVNAIEENEVNQITVVNTVQAPYKYRSRTKEYSRSRWKHCICN